MKRSFVMVDATAPGPGTAAADDSTADTRERLLDTAEELFARKGYSGTSVRDITATAGSNLAAVNYHFGSKHGLYREVLLRRLAAIRRQRLAALENIDRIGEGAGELAPTLRAFAEAFLAPVREVSPKRQPMRLLMREVVDPQLPRDLFETELVLPVQSALTATVAAAAPHLNERTVQLCVQSFIAQLVHVLHAHRFTPSSDDGSAAFELAELINHIVCFTVAALGHLQETQP
jgi:AcrR family transcriptional regulator